MLNLYTLTSTYERCVKAVKASYAAIIVALANIHVSTYEPEALRLSRALSEQTTATAMYMLIHSPTDRQTQQNTAN